MPDIILVTGATGYIASRLIPRLLAAGYQVRCLARHPQRLSGRSWFAQVQVVTGDVTRPESLPAAMQSVSAAYYLIHSMSVGHGYDRVDLQSARNFSQAAKAAGVQHIIYLGGLADPDEPRLSLHLKSRIESGAVLREAGVPVTEFRAGVIVGPGSVSFEMIRFIAEQFPVMFGPTWLRHRSQPIATSNVLDYLVAALTTPEAQGRVVEIGTIEVMTYIDIMSHYARLRGLRRAPLLLPFVPAWFMAYFIDLLTPVDRSYAYPLVQGLQNDSLVKSREALNVFSDIALLDYSTAVQRALAETHPQQVERIWLDFDCDVLCTRHEGMFVDYRRVQLAVAPADFFAALRDRLIAENFHLGALSSFQVEVDRPGLLCLRAGRELPGTVWLEWRLIDCGAGARLEQTAFFAPRGLPGFLSAYLLGAFYRRRLAQLFRELSLLV